MRRDGARNCSAVDMRAFLAAERIETVCNRIPQFRMRDVYAGIDHGNGDVCAMRKCMRLGQSKFQNRVLRRIAFGQCRFLLLQHITEIRLHRTDAGLSSQLSADDLCRATAGDTKQADGGADQREILRLQTRKPMTPRQLVGLRIGQRTIDLSHDLTCDRPRTEVNRLRPGATRTGAGFFAQG